jgi:hypothetical protein
MKIKILVYLSLTFFCVNSGAFVIERDSWVEYMKTALPTYQCQSEKYFRQCFSVTTENCEEVMASTTRICLDKERANIPDVLNQPEDGTKWELKSDLARE